MAQDIRNLIDVAEDESIVFPSWVNSVNAQFGVLETLIDELKNQLDAAEARITPFKLSIASNTTIAYLGGSILLGDRTITEIPSGAVEITEEGLNYIYVNSIAEIVASPIIPQVGYEIGLARRENGRVTSVQNFPPAKIREVQPDYLTLEELAPRVWRRIASARLSQDIALSSFGDITDNYRIIPFDTVEFGTGFNNAGEFTTLQSGLYIIQAQIRLYSPSASDLSGKISTFVAPSLGELGLAIAQSESASGDLILNGQNAIPARITPADILTIRSYITDGESDVRIRANSGATIWQVPEEVSNA